ncbi:MAG: hypothetical protein RLO52_11625 [Sandaracinaceae bacterium]
MRRPWADALTRSALVASAFLLPSCECEGGPRQRLAEVPEIPYPEACRTEGGGEGELDLSRTLRSGPDMREPNVVERFELRRAGACRVIRVRQEWPLGTADVDVAYDADGLPLRVWKRTTLPDARSQVGHGDLRVFDVASEPVRLARRGPDGSREGETIRGARPRAVIGPGRGLLTAWIQRADLDVSERLRESVLDVRESLAVIRDVTLQRHPDQEVESLGRVRVYTIYGREPVFTDDDGVIVGDMFGLRDAARLEGPIPDPMPDPGPFDPHTTP